MTSPTAAKKPVPAAHKPVATAPAVAKKKPAAQAPRTAAPGGHAAPGGYAASGGYAGQKAAAAPPQAGGKQHPGVLGKMAGAGQKLLHGAEHLGQEAHDAAMNAGGEAIGLAEMVGLKYSVKPYESQVSGQLFRGSRVDLEQMKGLQKQGVKGVVNLCAENNMDEAHAKSLGLTPLHIPIIDNTAPTMRQVQTFLDFVQGSAPAYVHCEAGKGRTGTMVACYRMAKEGWSAEKAIAEAKSFGLAMPCQIAFLEQFGAQREGKKPALKDDGGKKPG